MVRTLAQSDFNARANIIIEDEPVLVALGTPISALGGDDQVSGFGEGFGFGEDAYGLAVDANFALADGNDRASGTADLYFGVGPMDLGEDSYVAGIVVEGATLDGAAGNDRVQGTANIYVDKFIDIGVGGEDSVFAAGIDVHTGSRITTGSGNDTVSGELNAVLGFGPGPEGSVLDDLSATLDTGIGAAYVGGEDFFAGIALEGNGLIDAGSGDDVIGGAVSFGEDQITPGNDYIGGEDVYGIYGDVSSRINTGTGNDKVVGENDLGYEFGGGLTIDFGSGSDTLQGFGQMIGLGGLGIDTYDLRAYSINDFDIDKTGTTATFDDGWATSTVTDFEFFLFKEGLYTFAALPDTVVGP